MRLISFMLTVPQIKARTKTVTRRMGWENLKPGDLLKGVVKSQGLKKGEHPEVLCTIRIKGVRREPLNRLIHQPGYGIAECHREGFPNMLPPDFVAFFCRSHKGCTYDSFVTRIEFEYMEAGHG